MTAINVNKRKQFGNSYWVQNTDVERKRSHHLVVHGSIEIDRSAFWMNQNWEIVFVMQTALVGLEKCAPLTLIEN